MPNLGLELEQVLELVAVQHQARKVLVRQVDAHGLERGVVEEGHHVRGQLHPGRGALGARRRHGQRRGRAGGQQLAHDRRLGPTKTNKHG